MRFIIDMLSSKLYVGKPMGVPTYLHWTLLFLLIVQWSSGGFIGALKYSSLFLAVLLHELGHCFVAQRYGFRVSSILLCPIGGLAAINLGIPESKSEFWIAFAGPLTSLGLAILAAPVCFFTRESPIWSVIFTFFSVNVMIFAFNLIPALPLDGGRMLRACINIKWHNMLRSTKVATHIGNIVYYAMIAIGCFYRIPPLLIIPTIMMWIGYIELRALTEQIADKQEAEQRLAETKEEIRRLYGYSNEI